MVADIEELEEMDASELHARRLNAKEVLTQQRSGNFIFPVADGTVEIFGGEQRLKTSTLTRSVRNEEKNKKFFKENQMNYILQPHFKTTRRVVMVKLNMTSGLLQETSFIVITLNPESNCTCRKKNQSFPIPLKYIDVTRTTYTSLNIEDYWNRIVRCMDRLHKTPFIERKAT